MFSRLTLSIQHFLDVSDRFESFARPRTVRYVSPWLVWVLLPCIYLACHQALGAVVAHHGVFGQIWLRLEIFVA